MKTNPTTHETPQPLLRRLSINLPTATVSRLKQLAAKRLVTMKQLAVEVIEAGIDALDDDTKRHQG